MITGESRDNILKGISLIYKIRNKTYEDKLKWEIIYSDEKIVIFTTSYNVTDKKELYFTIRCNIYRNDDPNNTLKVSLKFIDDSNRGTRLETIKELKFKEYPFLITLIKLVKDRYSDKKTINLPTESKNEDFEKYKYKVVYELDNSIENTSLSFDVWTNIHPSILEIREEIMNAKTFKEVSDLLFTAHKLIEKNKKK